MIKYETEFQPDKVGAFLFVPAEVYHKAPGISNSAMKVFSRSPRDYKDLIDGRVNIEQTEYMEYGGLLHSAILDNADLSELVHVRPDVYGPDSKPWHNGATECKKWNIAHEDKPILSFDEFTQLNAEVLYVKNHPKFGVVLGGTTEVSCFARDVDTGYLLKGRFDVLKYQGGDKFMIADLKSTQDASTAMFSREILKRKYHVQAAKYRRILRRLVPNADVSFLFIALEKGRNMKCNFRYLSAQAMDSGDAIISRNLDQYRSCKIMNNWPEWLDDEENIGYIDLPDFCYENTELTGTTETNE